MNNTDRYIKVRIIYSQNLESMRLEQLAGKIGYIDTTVEHPKHGKYVIIAGLPKTDNEWFIPKESIYYIG